ncbi:MAG: carboxypeptidase regulatory-like domain-containing protein [Acidobacteria bacterium]|nr:carboxypeptidase regulatory-like domain-containing protein [Acidobacteriota bacterium]
MTRALFLAFVLALVGPAASASTIDVLVDVQGKSALPIDGKVVARSVDDQRPPIEFAIHNGVARAVPWNAGEWKLLLQAPGYFHAEQRAILEDGIKSITLLAWPAGSIVGVVVPPEGKRRPDSVRVTSWPVDAAPKQTIPPQVDVLAPVDPATGKFEAAVPAGALDVRVRAKGNVSHYRFDVALQAGARYDVGTLRLKPGASVVGYVAAAADLHLRALSDAIVRLAPAVTDSAPSAADRRRTGTLGITVTPNARGFYHFEGVAPGEYTVQAVNGRNLSSSVRILVVPEVEAFVNDRLLLEKPRNLTLRITPATGPRLQQWNAMLWRDVNGRFEDAREVRTRDGVVNITDLLPGTYSVSVGPSSDDGWAVREIVVSAVDEQLTIDVPFEEIVGSIHLGRTPLPGAKIVFGGETGAVRSTFIADGQGNFSGFLPGGRDSWSVTVSDSEPSVKRTVEDVRLVDDDGKLRADIVLPSAMLSGTVKDDRDEPVSGAIVTVERSGEQRGERMQTRSDVRGAFELTGLPAGAYQVQAGGAVKTAAGQPVFAESRLTTVSIPSGDEEVAEVSLTLRAGSRYFGRVLSAISPVIGAKVVAVPTNVARLVNVGTVSGADGSFRQELPADATEVDVLVAAPGFAFRLFHARVSPTAVEVAVDQQAGTLIVETNSLSNENTTDTLLRHAGAAYHLLPVAPRGNIERLSEDRYRITLPMMEPGEYGVCIGGEGDVPAIRSGMFPACKSGFLPAMGELRLSIAANEGDLTFRR